MNSLISDSVYLRVGNRRQFFFDDLLLEQTQNLTRRFHSPQPAGDRPVLVKDRPWEHVLYFTCNTWNVIRDPQDGLFKCWYEDWRIEDFARAASWVRPLGRQALPGSSPLLSIKGAVRPVRRRDRLGKTGPGDRDRKGPEHQRGARRL